jgi:hypothetical protein
MRLQQSRSARVIAAPGLAHAMTGSAANSIARIKIPALVTSLKDISLALEAPWKQQFEGPRSFYRNHRICPLQLNSWWTDLKRTGAIAGLVAGALGATAYAFHRPDDSIPFIAVWYGAMIALCASIGALLGPRLMRW